MVLLFHALFLQFDIDGDGAITSDELRNAMVKLLGEQTSQREIDAVVREADNNGDGTVDFEGKIHENTHKSSTAFFYSLPLHLLSLWDTEVE